jgi:chromosome segregation ATPase
MQQQAARDQASLSDLREQLSTMQQQSTRDQAQLSAAREQTARDQASLSDLRGQVSAMREQAARDQASLSDLRQAAQQSDRFARMAERRDDDARAEIARLRRQLEDRSKGGNDDRREESGSRKRSRFPSPPRSPIDNRGKHSSQRK